MGMEGPGMQKKDYEKPRLHELGTVDELTQEVAGTDKCAGSNDQFVPTPPVSPRFAGDCPTP